jgi:hypothetical protein
MAWPARSAASLRAGRKPGVKAGLFFALRKGSGAQAYLPATVAGFFC